MGTAGTGRHVVVAGGGIGGLALAIALRQRGVSVEVHEQARHFGTVGDAINLTPNAVRALDRLGVGQQLRPLAYRPDLRINRDWESGEATSTIPLGEELEATYGTPLMMLRRCDLVDALAASLPDVVVCADGIHSVVRDRVLGAQPPRYTGIVAHRTLVPTARVAGRVDDRDLASFVTWWGPDRTSQVATYPTGSGDEFSSSPPTRTRTGDRSRGRRSATPTRCAPRSPTTTRRPAPCSSPSRRC